MTEELVREPQDEILLRPTNYTKLDNLPPGYYKINTESTNAGIFSRTVYSFRETITPVTPSLTTHISFK